MFFLAEWSLNSGAADTTTFSTMNMLYYVAIILIVAKALGMLMRKLGLPQVVGMVLAGLLIGPAIVSRFGWGSFTGLIDPSGRELNALSTMSQIGVVLILFSSGLETDVKELKKSGFAATMIALAGVFVPIALGFIGAMAFMPGGFVHAFGDQHLILNGIFVGTILAATSVGITVETLRELGQLNGKIGQTIVSAAIIDDVIGIIVLSVVTSLKGILVDGGDSLQIWITVLKAVGFFAATIGIGLLARLFIRWMMKKYPNKRRTSIFELAMCFLFSWAAEEFFGIAAITGAYMAGLMLSGLGETNIVDKKAVTLGYLLFSPIFFAFIGISANLSGFNLNILWFGLVFVALGIVGKIIGCGAVARACKYKTKDSLRIGCGMIARGEVALAVYATGSMLIAREGGGAAGAIIGLDPMVPTIMLILISSILCPILLKILFRNKNKPEGHEQAETILSIDPSMREGGFGSERIMDEREHALNTAACAACGYAESSGSDSASEPFAQESGGEATEPPTLPQS